MKTSSSNATNWPLPTGNRQLPKHIAIIMDGNGRWAERRGLPRSAGHKKGADSLRNIMQTCRDAGVHYLTIYAFSTENWQRSGEEISDLMRLLQHYLQHELDNLHENGVRLRFIGERSALSAPIQKQITEAEQYTAHNAAFHLTVALSYGARQEIVQAIKLLAQNPAFDLAALTEIQLDKALSTHDLPEPDLLIRTGGEHRLSNFLLWQLAYTELYFTPILWPDFGAADLQEALTVFAGRERRYGK